MFGKFKTFYILLITSIIMSLFMPSAAYSQQAMAGADASADAVTEDSAPDSAPDSSPAANTPFNNNPANNNPADELSQLAPNQLQDLREKLDAIEQAERDLLEALREQTGQTAQTTQAAQAGLSDIAPQSNGLMSRLPKSGEDFAALGAQIGNKILGWATSPAFLAQLGVIFLAFFLSPLIAAQIKKRIFLFRDVPDAQTKFKLIRDYIYRSREFLRAIIMVILLALGAAALKAIPAFGDEWLVKLAQGFAVVFLLFSAIETFISNALYKKLAMWILIPLALLAVFGYYDNLIDLLNNTVLMKMGDTPITLMTMIRLVIFGAIFFKLGNYSNNKGQSAIRSQENLDSSTREVVAKIFQILLFTVIVILVLSAAKVPLSGLVMMFSALSLGLGLGLQPIAANFVSGMIILFDRSVQVGDFVVLPDGQSGFVEAINMRSTTVETTDGKDIMVPNTQFTEDAYENWTHKDPSQRYEVEFLVDYNTDLDSLEGILMPAIMDYSELLTEPEMPDLEFRSFEDSGIKMAIEFWCNGIDDGPNKFTSDVGFIIWRTLKANKIEMPLPQRVIYQKKG